jgi:hypothetical protein
LFEHFLSSVIVRFGIHIVVGLEKVQKRRQRRLAHRKELMSNRMKVRYRTTLAEGKGKDSLCTVADWSVDLSSVSFIAFALLRARVSVSTTVVPKIYLNETSDGDRSSIDDVSEKIVLFFQRTLLFFDRDHFSFECFSRWTSSLFDIRCRLDFPGRDSFNDLRSRSADR